jgi:hypothetical protein
VVEKVKQHRDIDQERIIFKKKKKDRKGEDLEWWEGTHFASGGSGLYPKRYML